MEWMSGRSTRHLEYENISTEDCHSVQHAMRIRSTTFTGKVHAKVLQNLLVQHAYNDSIARYCMSRLSSLARKSASRQPRHRQLWSGTWDHTIGCDKPPGRRASWSSSNAKVFRITQESVRASGSKFCSPCPCQKMFVKLQGSCGAPQSISMLWKMHGALVVER